MLKKYDFLIVGAGLYGAVFAHQATLRKKRCLIIEKRNHVGGNLYCELIEGINVHTYGAHIFHTNDAEIWEYVNQLVDFNRYTNSPIANYKGELYNLPFNMNTFYQLWKVKTPDEAKLRLKEEVDVYKDLTPDNLEEQALKLVGKDIYDKLIKGYTEKQWGRKAKDLPAFIIKRIPLRFLFDNNYFNDRYQGIPIGGYNGLIDKMLEGSQVILNCNYLEEKHNFSNIAGHIVYTGMLDAHFGYSHGKLEYRSLEFKNEVLDIPDFQGNAVVNYTDYETPYTRIIEHKHFEYGQQANTVITREYPQEWDESKEPYYPINDEKNARLFHIYKERANTLTNITFGGRLADYSYYDMDVTIRKALDTFNFFYS